MSPSRRKPKNATNVAARKIARAGAATAPRVKRTLTRVQRLREHILLELGIDKQDIARAIGTTPQTVSNILLDEHRSVVFEPKIVEYLRKRYIEEADSDAVYTIDALIARTGKDNKGTDWPGEVGDSSITRETLGWPEPSAPALPPEISRLVTD